MRRAGSRWRQVIAAAVAAPVLLSPTRSPGPTATTISRACPAQVIVLAEFADVLPDDRHARSIDCVVHWGLLHGDGGDFSPNRPVTRAQLDVVLDRLGDLVGLEGVPADPLGDVAPEAPVTRAELAPRLVRLLETARGVPLAARDHTFVDVDERRWTAVAKISGAGVVPALTGDRFEPDAMVSRAWLATFLARTLDHLVASGLLQVPSRAAFDVPPGRVAYLPLPSAPEGSYRLDVPERPDGTPARFNPCAPVRVVANFTAAPAGARGALVTALERLTEAMGTVWILEGETDERLGDPMASRAPFQPERYGHRWAPVLVNWPEPWTEPEVLGLGGSRTIDGVEVVTGDVRINPDADVSGDALVEVLMHELAHVAGLGHVDDPGQVMRHRLETGDVSADWGRGDLAALALVGRGSGCFHSVPPG